MSPQQARGLAEYLLTDFQQELPTTIRVIEAAPADKAPSKYQLTGKANKILTARGVGLNEA